MVYIHIPEALTEEEQMLMAKYAKLKKKASYCSRNRIFQICKQKWLFLEEASASIENQTWSWEADIYEAS